MGSETKTFHDLKLEVQQYNFCGKCGGCVSFCSADNLGALDVGPDGMPIFADEEKCLRCGICYMICPNIYELDDELKKKTNWEPPIGQVKDLTSARTTNPLVAQNCSDGGVVTSLLVYLMDSHLIDAALVSKSDGPFRRSPLLATTSEEIISAAGSHYDESFSVVEIGSKYSTYSPIMPKLKNLRGSSLDRIAMVGTPCQIHTIRKMQVLKVIPSDSIKYYFGLFCMENLSFNNVELEKLGKKYGFGAAQVVKINVKEDFHFYLKEGKVIHIPFEDLDPIARPACMVCPDFSAEFSDISFGGLGSPEGYTTVLIRSETGKQVYQKALTAGYIRERKFPSIRKARSDWMKTHNMIIDYAEKKRARASRKRAATASVFALAPVTP
jgi:coenzyme F420 hydrogenase subunit beta